MDNDDYEMLTDSVIALGVARETLIGINSTLAHSAVNGDTLTANAIYLNNTAIREMNKILDTERAVELLRERVERLEMERLERDNDELDLLGGEVN